MRKNPWVWIAAALLMVLHAGLILKAAREQSPVWDEIVYPAAGVDLLTSGKIRISRDHPPLGKILLAAPLLFWHPSPPPRSSDSNSFRTGFAFIHHNRVPPRTLILIPRLSAMFFSLALALIVFWEARRRWGDASALLALTLYTWSPAILAHASIALLELPLVFWMTASVVLFFRWRESSRSLWGWFWVAAWSAALLVKETSLLLAPLWIALIWRTPEKRWKTLAGLLAAWGIAEFAQRALGGGSWTALVLARNTDLSAGRFPVFFVGRFWNTAPPCAALSAWLMKTPLSTLTGLLAAALVFRKIPSRDPLILFSAGVLGITGILMLTVRSIIATSHYLILFPFASWFIAAAWHQARGKMSWAPVFPLLALVLAVESASAMPNPLAFFNAAVGGPARGWRLLGDSDQDWGQGLPALSCWMKRQRVDRLLLSYAGAGDPRIYGIAYQDVFSPALVTAEYRGEIFREWPGRMYFALSTKVAQTEPDAFAWLLSHRSPGRDAGPCFLIFDLTEDAEARAWLMDFYRQTGRPAARLNRV